MIYIPSELVNYMLEYVGYIPELVSKGWYKEHSDNVVHVLVGRYGNLESIIANGSVEMICMVMRYISNGGTIPYDINKVVKESAKKGYTRIIKWSIANGAKRMCRMARTATKYGKIHLAKRVAFIMNDVKVYDWIGYGAARSGNVDLLKWCIECGATDTTFMAKGAARGGHIDVLTYLNSCKAIRWGTSVREAAKRGYTHVVDYIYNLDCNTHLRRAYAASGYAYGSYIDRIDINIIQSSHFHELLINAAQGGNLSTIEYIINAAGTTYIPDYNWIASGAARCNHMYIVEWALQRAPVIMWDIVACGASRGGNVQLLQRAIDNGVTGYGYMMADAVKGGRMNIVQHLQTYTKAETVDILCACMYGYPDIAQYMA